MQNIHYFCSAIESHPCRSTPTYSITIPLLKRLNPLTPCRLSIPFLWPTPSLATMWCPVSSPRVLMERLIHCLALLTRSCKVGIWHYWGCCCCSSCSTNNPRQFRQVLSVPGGVAHTNQLLREWNPMRSFVCVSFTLGYILLMALFAQKSCVVLSRDVLTYNNGRMYGILVAATAGWVLLRHFMLRFVNWLFDTHDTLDRQMTVEFSVSIFTLFVMVPVTLLLLYNPTKYFIWIGLAILGLAAVLRLIYGIIETGVATKISTFYIFLYFCALEIAPVATLVTAGLRYFGHGSVF